MKIKLDENLPASLTVILAALHHNVHTVAEENLSGGSDRDVWEAAQRDARFLITWPNWSVQRIAAGEQERHDQKPCLVLSVPIRVNPWPMP